MVSENSRYKNAEAYFVTDSRGRQVKVLGVPAPPRIHVQGYHKLFQGQRLDHMAYKYLADGTAYWKIAEANGVMLAETLTEQPEIAIPTKF